jgi:cytidine deaminase
MSEFCKPPDWQPWSSRPYVDPCGSSHQGCLCLKPWTHDGDHGCEHHTWPQPRDTPPMKNQALQESLQNLGAIAWKVRENAHLHGKTAVGAAALSTQGAVFAGCNIEHRFRAHDIHAETNALSTMAAAGHGPAVAVVIAAARNKFTPCGGCMDWIYELGGPDCVVGFQGEQGGMVEDHRADELMPHYSFDASAF